MDRYTYKGKTYFTIRDVFMKDPTTRQWLQGILYCPEGWNTKDGMTPIYTREKQDFLTKFKKI